MLNIFPIQFLAPFAYFVLRVVLGFIFVHLGFTHIRARQSLRETITPPLFSHSLFFVWYLSLIELCIGSMLIAGLFTQVAALLTILFAGKLIVMHRRFTHPTIPSRLTYALMATIAFSLFITGAGVFAFDLPI